MKKYIFEVVESGLDGSGVVDRIVCTVCVRVSISFFDPSALRLNRQPMNLRRSEIPESATAWRQRQSICAVY